MILQSSFYVFKTFCYIAPVNPRLLTLKPIAMTVWNVIIGVLVLAFCVKACVVLRRRKRKVDYHPDISTRKRLKRFVNRFRHLEGIGD